MSKEKNIPNDFTIDDILAEYKENSDNANVIIENTDDGTIDDAVFMAEDAVLKAEQALSEAKSALTKAKSALQKANNSKANNTIESPQVNEGTTVAPENNGFDESLYADDVNEAEDEIIESVVVQGVLENVSETELFDNTEMLIADTNFNANSDEAIEAAVSAVHHDGSFKSFMDDDNSDAQSDEDDDGKSFFNEAFFKETAEGIADDVIIFTETLEDEPVPPEIACLEPVGDDEIITADDDDMENDDTDNENEAVPTFLPVDENTENTENAEIDGKKKKNFIRDLFPAKNDSVFEIIRKIIFLAATVVFICAGVMLVSTLVQSSKSVKDLEEIIASVTTTMATSIDSDGNVVTVPPTAEEIAQHNFDVMSIYEKYEDVVGFIEIDGCNIYYPVVKGLDNSYYLTHTYYGKQNKAGAIFMDFRATFTSEHNSPNLVLYGHNERDGTMFGNLKYYKTDNINGYSTEFYTENPTITLRSFDGVDTYIIYAYFVTNALEKQDSNGEVFHYHDYYETLSDKETFTWYKRNIMARTQIISPVDIECGDELLLLSTCSNEFSNSRFVVCARKLRDGESVDDFDFSTVKPNYNARGVDWEAIMSGETTTVMTTVTSETTVPEDTEDTENSEESTKKKKKKTTTEETSAETTVPDSAGTGDDLNSAETTVTTTKFVKPTEATKKVDITKTNTTTADLNDTSKSDENSDANDTTSVDENTEAVTTISKPKKKTTTVTTEETTTAKKKTTAADVSATEETTAKSKKTTTVVEASE